MSDYQQGQAIQGNVVAKLIEVLQRRWWFAVVPFVTAMAVVVTVVQVLPEIYQSRVTVIIEQQQIPTELVRSTVTSDVDTRLQTISQEVLSRDRLNFLIDRFNLYPESRGKVPLEALLATMRSDVQVRFSGGGTGYGSSTVAFSISYRGADPVVVADVTNALADFFVEQNVKVRERQASGTSEFLKDQLKEMQAELEEMERRVSAFKASYTGELPHQQPANLAALEQLNVRLQINSDNRIRASQRLSQLETQLAEAKQEGTALEGPTASTRLAELRLELRNLQKQYSDRYPDVVRVKREIAALEEQLSSRETSPPNDPGASAELNELAQTINSARVELETLQAESARLNEQIAGYQSRVQSAPLREQQYQVLMRDYETTSELYRDLLARQTEAQLAEEMERRQRGEQFRVIEPAVASEVPAAPDRKRLFMMGAMLSIALAAGLVFLLEQIDHSFHHIDDLRQRIDVPILASIPNIATAKDLRRRRWRHGLNIAAVVVGFVAVVGTSYIVARDNARLVAMFVE